MPPLNVTKASDQHQVRFVQSDSNNNRTDELKKLGPLVDEEEKVCREFRYFHVRKPVPERKHVRYIYIDDTKFGLVWPNIIMFAVLHVYYAYALVELIFNVSTIYRTWFFRELKNNFFFVKIIVVMLIRKTFQPDSEPGRANSSPEFSIRSR